MSRGDSICEGEENFFAKKFSSPSHSPTFQKTPGVVDEVFISANQLLIHRYRGPPSPAGEGFLFHCFYNGRWHGVAVTVGACGVLLASRSPSVSHALDSSPPGGSLFVRLFTVRVAEDVDPYRHGEQPNQACRAGVCSEPPKLALLVSWNPTRSRRKKASGSSRAPTPTEHV